MGTLCQLAAHRPPTVPCFCCGSRKRLKTFRDNRAGNHQTATICHQCLTGFVLLIQARKLVTVTS
jgi:hypothetical protein